MALSTTQYGYIIDPMVPFTDDKGKTIKDGFVRVFVAGSSTPVITYRNFDGAANQDLIELDNSGRTKTSVIGSKGLTYKVCVYDKHHSQESPILTVDKVSVIGANITAGAGATLVTGLDGLTTKPDGFVDASVVGTDGYVALDHTLVTDDLNTDAKVTAVEDDRYVPLLNEDVNDPDSKMTLGRLWQWVLGKIKSLSTTITAFREGDVIPVDGPSGTAKMIKDDLLKETAENTADSGLVVRQEDAFGNGLFKSIFHTYKSSEDFTATATYINYGIYKVHLAKTATTGYTGCSLRFADTDDYSVIATKKVRITLVNRSDNDADVNIHIAKYWSWETKLLTKKAVFDKIFTLDVDLSQIGMTGVTNVSIEMNEEQDISLDVYCVEVNSALNVDGAQNALMLDGKDASNYVTQKDIGKIQAFDFSTLTYVITSNSSLNPCSATMSGNTFTVDLDKTTPNGYVGATARISSNASTISTNKLLFKITNSSASTATFEVLLTANKNAWSTVAGIRNVTIEGNGSAFVDYDFSQYAGTFGSGNVFLCIRYEGATAQHLTLSCFGYVMNDGSVPDVDNAWDSFKFNGKTYEEVDADIGSSKLTPDMLLTDSYRKVISSDNTISVSESNGVYSVVAVRGATGYVGIVVKIADDASTLLDSASAVIVVNNKDTVNSTKFNLFFAVHNYDWGGGIPIKRNVTIQPNSNAKIPVDMSQYASSFGSGFIGLAIEFANLNSTNTISFELSEEKSEIVPVNFALDSSRLNGKTYEDIIGGDYITCWGDSLTANGGWTTRLQELSGRRVFNAGTGGENVVTITARQGADVMIVNDMTIPADAQAITIATAASKIDTELGGLASPLLQGGSSHVNPCKIGDIEGNLAWTGSRYNDPSGTWTFTRSVSGDAVVIDRPTAIRTNYDRNYNDPYLMIIFMGQNGGYTDDAELIERHRLMIEHSTAKHFLVLGFSSGTEASRADYESAMKYEFGRNFLSLREYLAHPIYTGGVITSCYGLADEGLTPTADDLAKIAVGQVPSQLLEDAVHYTSATKTIIGNLIYKHLCELNIL